MSVKFKSVVIKITIGVTIVFCVIASGVFWALDPLNFRAPSDKKLIGLFYGHRAAFETLRQMMIEDQASYISKNNFVGTIDESRKQEYKKLLLEIYPDLKVTLGDKNSVSFVFAGGGLSAISPGWMKGIVCMPGDYYKRWGYKLVQNLDKTYTLPPGGYLRDIEAQWFIVYERTED